MEKVKKNKILVKFMDNASKESIKEFVQNKHCPKRLENVMNLKHSHADIFELDDEDDIDSIVSELHNHNDVHYAQPDYVMHACELPKIDKQWGLENDGEEDKWGNKGVKGMDIDIEDAWKITMGSEDVVIAVIDTGTDLNHIELKDSIYKAPEGTVIDLTAIGGGIYHGDPSEWNFVNNDPEGYGSLTDAKHGTEVAAIIAARMDRGEIVGVAPKVKLLPLKIMSKKACSTSDAIEAIEYAKALGIKIANCSWGGYNENPALMHHMQNADMLFICAGGNNGENTDEKPFYPACFDIPNVISVAAVNNRGELWMMSNYGSKIDVAAPGAGIYSAIASADDKGYDYDSGTSLATPYVTGIAALMFSNDRSMSAADMKKQIIESCSPIKHLEGKVASGGLVNAFRALVKK
ncbi:MAG: S8 family serine peptidase [Bacillota bacterium]